MSPAHPLSAVFAKLSRADRQIANLHNDVQRFFDEAHYVAEAEPYRNRTFERVLDRQQVEGLFGVGADLTHLQELREEKDGQYRFRARMVERFRIRLRIHKNPPTLEWAVIVGEVVHDLRSALDQLVWQLSYRNQSRKRNGGVFPPAGRLPRSSPWAKISFPILLTPGSQNKTWRDQESAALKLVNRRLVPRFRATQPFARGRKHPEQHPLAILHDLWISDKHRTTQLIAEFTQFLQVGTGGPIFREPTAPSLSAARVVWRRKYGPLKDNDVVARFTLGTHLLNEAALTEFIRDNLLFRFDVHFEAGPLVYEGQAVLPLLRRLSHTTRDVVAQFENEFS